MKINLNFFNPLKYVGDSEPFAFSNPLQSGFFEKVYDASAVFSLVFDFLTLYIFPMAHEVKVTLDDFSKQKLINKKGFEKYAQHAVQLLAKLIYLPIAGLSILGNNLIRPAAAGLLTLITLPFIVCAHIIFSGIAASKTNDVLVMDVKIKEKNSFNKEKSNCPTTTKALKEFLSDHDRELRDLKLVKIKGAGEFKADKLYLKRNSVGSDRKGYGINFPVTLTFQLSILKGFFLENHCDNFRAKVVCQDAKHPGIRALAQIDASFKNRLDERKFFRK